MNNFMNIIIQIRAGIFIVTAFAFGSLAAAPAAPQTQPMAGLRLDARVAPASALPMEPIVLDLTITNESTGVAKDAPMLTFVNGNITMHAVRDGVAIPYSKPVPSPEPENQTFYKDLKPRESISARFKLVYDWSTERFPLCQPGNYTLTISVNGRSGAEPATSKRAAVSTTVSFTILEPTEPQRRELMELHATEAYQYSFAPSAILGDPDADTKVAHFLDFANRHPNSPFGAEAPYVAAGVYRYRAAVSYKNDPAKSADANRMLKIALEDYIRAGKGSYLKEAREDLLKWFKK